MNATIEHSRVVLLPDRKPEMPRQPIGPVLMPDLRVEEDVFGRVQLLAGSSDEPVSYGVCASREVAERTRDFFGGNRA